ncbi:hypothetical protein RB195_016197 [Necator americanus]|uniref:Uncharacterized protein n=1 Tax=Necator americanus TaxID=51031 RepID=A0ABR1E808_NECAM
MRTRRRTSGDGAEAAAIIIELSKFSNAKEDMLMWFLRGEWGTAGHSNISSIFHRKATLGHMLPKSS